MILFVGTENMSIHDTLHPDAFPLRRWLATADIPEHVCDYVTPNGFAEFDSIYRVDVIVCLGRDAYEQVTAKHPGVMVLEIDNPLTVQKDQNRSALNITILEYVAGMFGHIEPSFFEEVLPYAV